MENALRYEELRDNSKAVLIAILSERNPIISKLESELNYLHVYLKNLNRKTFVKKTRDRPTTDSCHCLNLQATCDSESSEVLVPAS